MDPEERDVCDRCGGSGDLGPYGWEYPEYETCDECGGSGYADTGPDPDEKFERMREERL